MNILIFDTETTGLPKNLQPGEDGYPSLIELGAIMVNENNELMHTLATFVKNPGVEIPLDVIAIHGITNLMVDTHGLPPAIVHDHFYHLLSQAHVIVAQNIQFDIGIMANFSMSNQNPFTSVMTFDHRAIDTKIVAQQQGLPSAKLSGIHKHLFGVEPVVQHRAMADVMTTRKVLFKMIELGWVKL